MRFECQPGCVKCCTQDGFVYVSDDDILRLAAHLQMTPKAFEKRYVFRTNRRSRLRVPRHAKCEFLTAEGCSVHAAKPTQCRIFPFWPELVGSKREWRKTGAWCPGIGKGELIHIDVAKGLAQEMEAAYPAMYGK